MSQYIYCGRGVVAADKNDGSKNISVYLTEKLPFFEGEIHNGIATTKRTGTDADGKPYEATLQSGTSVKAIWITEGNRITSPNVRKGEMVDVFEAEGTNKFYWKEVGGNNHLRRGEAVTWAFNASSTDVKQDEPLTARNSYVFTVDTKKGMVGIKTSTVNKEKVGYSVQMNGKDGLYTVSDTAGNIIQINSVKNTISIKNSDNTYITLTGKTIVGFSAGEIKLKSPKITLEGDVEITGNTKCKSALDVTGTSKFNGFMDANNAHISNLQVDSSNALNEN